MLKDLKTVIKSSFSKEFILHFVSYDLRAICERREDFLNLCKPIFAFLQPTLDLRVYVIVRYCGNLNCNEAASELLEAVSYNRQQ